MKRVPIKSVWEHQCSREHEQITDGHQNREGHQLTAHNREIPGYKNGEDVPRVEQVPHDDASAQYGHNKGSSQVQGEEYCHELKPPRE